MKLKIEIEIKNVDDWSLDWSDNEETKLFVSNFELEIIQAMQDLGIRKKDMELEITIADE